MAELLQASKDILFTFGKSIFKLYRSCLNYSSQNSAAVYVDTSDKEVTVVGSKNCIKLIIKVRVICGFIAFSPSFPTAEHDGSLLLPPSPPFPPVMCLCFKL